MIALGGVSIKFIGCIIVILGTTYMGFYKCFCMQSRVRRLKAFKDTFIMIKGHIGFAGMNMQEIFETISCVAESEHIKEFYKYVSTQLTKKEDIDFYHVWENAVITHIKGVYLNDKDCFVIEKIGRMPVYLDGESQIKVIDMTVFELDRLIENAQEDIKQKGKVYKCLGVMAGIFIVILLI